MQNTINIISVKGIYLSELPLYCLPVITIIICDWILEKRSKPHIRSFEIRPMKLEYQFLAQIFENLMRAGGRLLFIIHYFPKAQHTSQT